MYNKKAIHPVMATMLLLIVTIISIVTFQSWYSGFESSIFTKTEIKSQDSTDGSGIDDLIDSTLYFENGDNNNLQIKKIKINGEDCSYMYNNVPPGVTGIDLSGCFENLDAGSKPEVTVVTENQIFSEKFYLKQKILSIVGYNSSLGQWIGGSDSDQINSVYVDSSGNIYVGGYAQSDITDDNLVTFNGTYSGSGSSEGFISKFDSNGNSLWGQWLGGSNIDIINSVYVDSSGNIYVGGYAQSDITDDNLVTFNGTYSGSGSYEGFISKFDSNGNSLWGQWLGGSNIDIINSVYVDSSGNIYVGGYARTDITDDNLVTFNGNYSGFYEGFISKFDSNGNSLWGQWLGGSNYDYINSVYVDSSGNIYVGGDAQSDITDDNLVTFNGTYSGSGSYEGFISKFDSNGNSLWGQWLGGSNHDYINSVYVDSSGNIYVGGYARTDITDDNLTAFNGNHSGFYEGFISKFDSNGNSLWGQWLGGSDADHINSVYVDSSGNIYVGGYAQSDITDDNLVTFNGTYSGSGSYEGFISKFDSNGNSLWGQWLGGSNHDYIRSVYVDSSGNIYVGGYAQSDITDDNLITFNGTHTGNKEGFFVKFEPLKE